MDNKENEVTQITNETNNENNSNEEVVKTEEAVVTSEPVSVVEETAEVKVENEVKPADGEIQNQESKEENIVPEHREVRVINNEIELIIDEPLKEEVKEEVKVEKVESKRLIPFIKNDDLFILLAAIVLVVGALNLDKIYNFFSKHNYKLDPSTGEPIVEEGEKEEEKPPVVDNNEYTLTCSKKNSETDYIFDYVYTVKYKGVAYQMTYEIKSTDLSMITDQEEYDRKSAALSTFVDSKFLYLDNALNMEGSYLETNDDGTFKQTIDLNKVTKNEINEIEEVMFFEIDDSINLIRTKFENNDYVCE